MSETEDNRPDSDAPTSGEAAPGKDDASSANPEADVQDTHAYLLGLLEAILFVAEGPLSLKELARAAKIDRKRASELLAEIREDYRDRGMTVQEVAEGFCFRSNPAYAAYIRGHLAQRPVRLSRAQLETLSIIAYRQPITRPEVDDIRGVDSGPVLKGLLERDLIKILGKKDEPGRPMLYGTSAGFLELFNMKSLQDLPTLKEFTELSEESRMKFEQKLGVEPPAGPIGEGEEDDGPRAEGAASPNEPESVDAPSAEEGPEGEDDEDEGPDDEEGNGDGGDEDEDGDDEDDDDEDDEDDDDDEDEDDDDDDAK